MTHNIIFRSFSSCIWPSQHFCIWRKNIYVIPNETSRELDIIRFQIQLIQGLIYIFTNITKTLDGMNYGAWHFGLWQHRRWNARRGTRFRHDRSLQHGETYPLVKNWAQIQNSEEMLRGREGFNFGRRTSNSSTKSSGKFTIL